MQINNNFTHIEDSEKIKIYAKLLNIVMCADGKELKNEKENSNIRKAEYRQR